ncbi:MAG: DUF4349 domain-containing protein [Leptospiraceae bacterium]|nr:DUF4349 domain-containing protein [Leptospiraceae bacterium]
MHSLRRSPLLFILLATLGCFAASERGAGSATEMMRKEAATDALSEDAGGGVPGEPVARQLIRRAWLEVEVAGDQLSASGQRARDVAERYKGYVSNESISEDYVQLVLRIPDAQLENALNELGTAGEITDRRINVDDVTMQYTDILIRIENAKKLQHRLNELLAKAENVRETLEIERELARITTELERMEGQRRLLENQIQLATLTVTYRRSEQPGPLGWVFYGAYRAVRWLFIWDN